MADPQAGGFQVWPPSFPWPANAAVAVVAPLLLTYLITLWNSFPSNHKGSGLRKPRSVPYLLPYIGHSLTYKARGRDFLLENVAKFGRATLHKITLPGLDQWVTSSPDHVGRVFRATGMTMIESHTRAMERSFGMSPAAVEFYRADDSGYGPNPKAGSTVKPGDRILLDVHNLVNRNLTGSSLTTITAQFQRSLSEQFSELDVPKDAWLDIPDLSTFMRTHVMKATLTSMFGPHLLSLNPTFIEDFWAWNIDMGPLFMGLPRWLIPGAYRRRDKLLESIMRWHAYAHAHYDCEEDEVEWEPYFGSRFSRRRQRLFGRWDAMDARARAAEDLSFIWASNANSGFASIWFVVELLIDSKLMARVQQEISPALQPPTDGRRVPTFDVDKLTSGPLCQSIYAEILRLQVAVMISRQATHKMEFDGWEINPGERVAVASTTEGLDEAIWNAGTAADPHPLKEFWADRFLTYPNDPNSGPLKKTSPTLKPSTAANASSTKESVEPTGEETDNIAPKFSMAGLTNSWIPYSGGARHCPGRHFAKQEMIAIAAMMITAFEVELATEMGWAPESDPDYFGFGTMPPKGKIPCRIRRRERKAGLP